MTSTEGNSGAVTCGGEHEGGQQRTAGLFRTWLRYLQCVQRPRPTRLPGHHSLFGALFGLAWTGSATAPPPGTARHGTRNFAPVNQVVTTKRDVLVEHLHAARAQDLLAAMPREATS